MSTNPLIAAYKKPAVYVNLPSEGKWYENPPKLSVDGELAIYPMSARDELITKTPDALFNGEATIALIKSCCPDILEPETMPVNDLLVILIAIRQASYGDEIDIDIRCPECTEMNQLAIDINRLLSTIKKNENPDVVELPNDFKVNVKPYTLTDRTRLQLQQVKQQRLLQSLQDEELSDEERQKQFGQTFVELAALTVELIANCIASVVAPDLEEPITDNAVIKEWLQSISKKDYDNIRDAVESLSENPIDNKFTATCQECSHTWQTNVELDMANFFAG
jgi:hypothetical protein